MKRYISIARKSIILIKYWRMEVDFVSKLKQGMCLMVFLITIISLNLCQAMALKPIEIDGVSLEIPSSSELLSQDSTGNGDKLSITFCIYNTGEVMAPYMYVVVAEDMQLNNIIDVASTSLELRSVLADFVDSCDAKFGNVILHNSVKSSKIYYDVGKVPMMMGVSGVEAKNQINGIQGTFFIGHAIAGKGQRLCVVGFLGNVDSPAYDEDSFSKLNFATYSTVEFLE